MKIILIFLLAFTLLGVQSLFAATPPTKDNDSLRTVQFYKYKGPGRKNLINTQWAEELLTGHKTSDIIKFNEPTKIVKIQRETSDKCWLPESQPIWFTAGSKEDPDHWKEEFLWAGYVMLVKDIITQKDGKVTTEYYLTRGKDSIKGRKALPEDRPSHYPNEWK